MNTEFAEKRSVVGPDGAELVVNEDGSINSGAVGNPGSGSEFAPKRIVVGANGAELVVNADGSINAS